ncbi:flagellar hook-length control protein FliK [Robertmurraya andreesenii]|uniref:Flagellar hook-length control protein FliK n=1 Tax=Anoxybacillus andreesenii TaxID=1325932 RepID=A0ABT9V7A6_9BACL|nr:flagellar hook-length control protein FliK [Robertmurraya andreesenii]MDQ0156812.1 flagellar hook-length control protein FliK [Robertmurraya andreesenii]
MEIGGLGTVKTLISSANDNSQSSQVSGFLGVFGALLTEENSSIENASLGANPISKEELLNLIQLLKTEDILDVEGGMELLNKALSTDNEQEIISFVKSLVLGDSNLKNLVELASGQISDKGQLEDLENGSAKEGTARIEDLIQVVEQLLSMPIQELSKLLNGEMQNVIKAIKLIDLTFNERNPGFDDAPLKALIHELTKKLELLGENGKGLLLDSGKQVSRMEYLHRTFNTVAAEWNSEAQTEQRPINTKTEAVSGVIPFQQMSKAEQLTLHLSQSGRPTNSAELIKQFENILARSQFSNVAGAQKLLIKLNPEHLGALRIELIQRDAGLVARIMTTTQAAKDALETHLNGLRQAFGSQNIQVDRVEVSQAMAQQQDRYFGREQGQQSQQQWQDNEEKNKQDEKLENEAFNFSLEEALVNTEV